MSEPNAISPKGKPYEKPAIRQVRLVAEEAVLTGCKSSTTTGPKWTGSCQNPGEHNPCSTLGS